MKYFKLKVTKLSKSLITNTKEIHILKEQVIYLIS